MMMTVELANSNFNSIQSNALSLILEESKRGERRKRKLIRTQERFIYFTSMCRVILDSKAQTLLSLCMLRERVLSRFIIAKGRNRWARNLAYLPTVRSINPPTPAYEGVDVDLKAGGSGHHIISTIWFHLHGIELTLTHRSSFDKNPPARVLLHCPRLEGELV